MSDFAGSLYNSPVSSSVFGSTSEETGTLSGVKPFELESELAALRRQLRTQIESRQILIAAHTAELAARDARTAELQEAIRLNEEELKRLTKNELDLLARHEQLPLRSKMNKAQLARTLRRHYRQLPR